MSEIYLFYFVNLTLLFYSILISLLQTPLSLYFLQKFLLVINQGLDDVLFHLELPLFGSVFAFFWLLTLDFLSYCMNVCLETVFVMAKKAMKRYKGLIMKT